MHDVLPRLSKTPGAIRRKAPLLGEHNQEIPATLGIDDAGVARLRNEGVI